MKNLGDKGELIAIKYLLKKGYKILDTNFKYSRIGEIDIIAQNSETIIFVEVKYRTNNKFGTGEEAITTSKLSKFKKTIFHYCNINKIDLDNIQFDAIIILEKNGTLELKHHQNQEI